MRVVLDTNVLFAAFATRGLCEAVFEVCLASHRLVLSKPILAELRRHLRGKLKVPPRHADAIVELLREEAEIVEPADVPSDACRDPDDLVILGTAAAGEADALVTGDDDLLALERFGEIPILRPRAFYDRLG